MSSVLILPPHTPSLHKTADSASLYKIEQILHPFKSGIVFYLICTLYFISYKRIYCQINIEKYFRKDYKHPLHRETHSLKLRVSRPPGEPNNTETTEFLWNTELSLNQGKASAEAEKSPVQRSFTWRQGNGWADSEGVTAIPFAVDGDHVQQGLEVLLLLYTAWRFQRSGG